MTSKGSVPSRRRSWFCRTVGLLCVTATLIGCGASKQPDAAACLAIAAEYQSAMLGVMPCDPTAANSCSAGRNVVVSVESSDGGTQLQGICDSACLGAVDPSHTAALATVDSILSRFTAQGCTFVPRCWCPPPSQYPARCDAGSGTCVGMWAGNP